MDCNNQLSIFSNPYLVDELVEEIAKNLDEDDMNALSAASKELHKKIIKIRQKLITNPTSFDQHLPPKLFEHIVKKYLYADEIRNLSGVSHELYKRIKHEFFLEKVHFDTHRMGGIKRLNDYLTQAGEMNVGVVVSLSSVSNTDVWDVIYDHLNSIRVLDLSTCSSSVSNKTNVKDLLPKEYQKEEWVKGLFEGNKFKQLVLPEGVDFTLEEVPTPISDKKSDKKKGRVKETVKKAIQTLNPKNVLSKKSK